MTIINGTRVRDTEGYTGVVQGRPEYTFAGPTVTVKLDAEFAHTVVGGRVDVPISQLTEITGEDATSQLKTAVVTGYSNFCLCDTPYLDQDDICRRCNTQWS